MTIKRNNLQAKVREKKENLRTQINNFIIESLQESKAKEIVKYDLRDLETPPTDFFVICEADSTTHVKAIAERLEKDLKTDYGILPSYTDGKDGATWIALDYFTTVVHIFFRETRTFYDLEGLWEDATITDYENE